MPSAMLNRRAAHAGIVRTLALTGRAEAQG